MNNIVVNYKLSNTETIDIDEIKKLSNKAKVNIFDFSLQPTNKYKEIQKTKYIKSSFEDYDDADQIINKYVVSNHIVDLASVILNSSVSFNIDEFDKSIFENKDISIVYSDWTSNGIMNYSRSFPLSGISAPAIITKVSKMLDFQTSDNILKDMVSKVISYHIAKPLFNLSYV